MNPAVTIVFIKFSRSIQKFTRFYWFLILPKNFSDWHENVRIIFILIYCISALSHSSCWWLHFYRQLPQFTWLRTLLQSSRQQMLGNFHIFTEQLQSDRSEPNFNVIRKLNSCLLKNRARRSKLFSALFKHCGLYPKHVAIFTDTLLQRFFVWLSS